MEQIMPYVLCVMVGILAGYIIGVCRMFGWIQEHLGIKAKDDNILRIILKRLAKYAREIQKDVEGQSW